MRATLVSLSLVLALPAFAQTAPLQHLTPPQGTFFDDPVALSTDGKLVAAIATDAATQATLEIFDTTKKDAPLTLASVATTVTRIELVTPDRVLIVSRRMDGKLEAQLVSVKGTALVADKKKLGPADSIVGVTLSGKRAISLYERRAGTKPGAEHTITIVGTDGHMVSKTHFTEDAEGGLRTRAGLVRMLWWYDGYTRLAAQRVGQYDKAKDIRRPDQLIHLDTTNDKILDDHEIEDLMQFTKMIAVHRAHPGEDTYVRYAEDHRNLVLETGLTEAPLPLSRELAVYEPSSLSSTALSDRELLIVAQVDSNNADAIAHRTPDKDDVDLYKLDLTTLKTSLSMPRVMVLPGLGRPARVTAAGGRALVLRKDRGFDRGGVALDLYALP